MMLKFSRNLGALLPAFVGLRRYSFTLVDIR